MAPGALELCDGMDNDCNGSADDGCSGATLLLGDGDPWGETYWDDELDAIAQPYVSLGSASIPFLDVGGFDLVIIPSQQDSDFNDAIEAMAADLETYVEDGGRVILMLATYTSYDPIESLPFGAVHEHDSSLFAEENDVLDPAHPIMAGLTSPLQGNLASHGRLLSFGDAHPLTANDQGDVTSYLKEAGFGALYASSVAIEFGGNTDLHPIGGNAIDYLLTYP